MRKSVRIFCPMVHKPDAQADHSAEEHPHPGVNFRINELILKHPAIFHAMDCNRYYRSKFMFGCGLKGPDLLSNGLGD